MRLRITTRIRTRAVVIGLTIVAGALLAGCGSAVPSLPAPSPACGTFHLDVSNGSSHPVLVRLDDGPAGTLVKVDAGDAGAPAITGVTNGAGC